MAVKESPEALLARMERLGEAVSGPGMGTSLRGVELRGLLDLIHDLQAQVAQAGRRQKRAAAKKPKAGEATAEAGVLDQVVAATADIMEGHPELWGQPLWDALQAWGEQTGCAVDDTWKAAVEGALGGGGA